MTTIIESPKKIENPFVFPDKIDHLEGHIEQKLIHKSKIRSFLEQLPLEAIALAVAAIGANFFIPTLALPLLVSSATIFVTTLVFKISQRYNIEVLNKLTNKLYQLDKLYPKLQTIAFICTLAISLLSSTLGMILAIPVSAYGVFIVNIETKHLSQPTIV